MRRLGMADWYVTRQQMKLVKPYLKGKYPGADYINKHGLLIGCHQYLTRQDLDHIIKSVKEFYA